MPSRTTIEPYRPFTLVGNDKSIFRINSNNDVEVFITNARFTTVPDNKWTTRVTNSIERSEIEYYNQPIEQPEAFTDAEKYRYLAPNQPTKADKE